MAGPMKPIIVSTPTVVPGQTVQRFAAGAGRNDDITIPPGRSEYIPPTGPPGSGSSDPSNLPALINECRLSLCHDDDLLKCCEPVSNVPMPIEAQVQIIPGLVLAIVFAPVWVPITLAVLGIRSLRDRAANKSPDGSYTRAEFLEARKTGFETYDQIYNNHMMLQVDPWRLHNGYIRHRVTRIAKEQGHWWFGQGLHAALEHYEAIKHRPLWDLSYCVSRFKYHPRLAWHGRKKNLEIYLQKVQRKAARRSKREPSPRELHNLRAIIANDPDPRVRKVAQKIMDVYAQDGSNQYAIENPGTRLR